MPMLVHERPINLEDAEGNTFDRVAIFAEPQPGGTTWKGWIEFISADGEQVLQTDRETTQSTLDGVAYWATGLELAYFEGAFARARARTMESSARKIGRRRAVETPIAVRLRLHSVDPEAPFHLMATRTLVPGLRRYIHNGGIILYEGPAEGTRASDAGVHDFIAQFGSPNAAALMANRIWSDLHGLGVRLEIEGEEVPLRHLAIKDALLGAVVG